MEFFKNLWGNRPRFLTGKYWISNDYAERIARVTTKTVEIPVDDDRRNPEEFWHDKLFYFGLVAEGVSLIYFIGWKIQFEKDGNTTNLVQNTDSIQMVFCLFALASLLIHQIFIRNTFKKINEITTNEYLNNKLVSLFPNRLMYSDGEYLLRSIFFLFLSALTGEITYLILVSSKLFNFEATILFLLTYFFIFACAFTSLIALAWSGIVYMSLRQKKKEYNSNQNQTSNQIAWDDSGREKVKTFLWSGSLSILMWLFIIAFVVRKDIWFINILFFAASLSYTFIIFKRLWFAIKKKETF